MKSIRNATYLLTVLAASNGIQNLGAATIYNLSAGTAFGANAASVGTGPTFADNMDGTFTLSTASNSGNASAAFLDSSDEGTVAALLGRSLTSSDIVTVTATIVSSNATLMFNGNEFGLTSAAGFRANPNLLFQADASEDRGGLAPFFATSGTGANLNTSDAPGQTLASIQDGATLTAVYDSLGITYTVSDIVPINVNAGDTTTADSFSFSFSDAAYVANFETLVGDSLAYFSFQQGGGGPQNTVLSEFSIDVVPEPSSLSLLALAGSFLLRRKRR